MACERLDSGLRQGLAGDMEESEQARGTSKRRGQEDLVARLDTGNVPAGKQEFYSVIEKHLLST